MRVAVYKRMSQDRSGEGLGVERQDEDCQRLVLQRGWTVTADYTDNSVSASTERRRPQYQAMLAAMRAKQVDAVVAWSMDRLVRRLADLEELATVCEQAGVTVALVRGSDMDLSTPSGRLVARIMGSVARHEVEAKSDRQVREAQQRASRGVPNGGRRAFGYSQDGMTIDPEEARLVKDAFTRISLGEALSAMCARLNGWGVTTTMGNEWRHNALRIMLQNPRYIGKRAYRGEVVGDAAWPAIVDQELFDAVQGVLAGPGRRTNRVGSERRWIGAGLFLCGAPGCSGKMFTRYRSTGDRTYRCSQCRMTRAAEKVDQLVDMVMRERLSRGDAAELLAPEVEPAQRDEVAELRRRRRSLSTLLVDGVLTEAEVRTEGARLDAMIAGAAVAGKDRTAMRAIAQAADPVAAWVDASPREKADALDAVLVVVLLPIACGRRVFDPASVVFDWR